MRMKRLTAPKFWKIERKKKRFIISLRPGPHTKKTSIPLGVIIRDYLKYAETLKEVKAILNKNIVKVNEKIRKDYKFPIGLMDIVSIGDIYYRIMPDKNGLSLKIVEKDKKIKLSRIANKTYIKGDRVQINLHDGQNFVISKSDDQFKTNDVIVFDILQNKIKNILKFQENMLAVITGGSNLGKIGVIKKIETTKSSKSNIVTLEIDKKNVRVPKDYVFVIGEKEPVIEV